MENSVGLNIIDHNKTLVADSRLSRILLKIRKSRGKRLYE